MNLPLLTSDTVHLTAIKTDRNGERHKGQMVVTFTMHGDPILRWENDPPETPTVEDELGINPTGLFRWTAFRTGGKMLTVVLLQVEPPYGCWWLGRAETLEQAENIFWQWIRAQPALGPSYSQGDYGI